MVKLENQGVCLSGMDRVNGVKREIGDSGEEIRSSDCNSGVMPQCSCSHF